METEPTIDADARERYLAHLVDAVIDGETLDDHPEVQAMYRERLQITDAEIEGAVRQWHRELNDAFERVLHRNPVYDRDTCRENGWAMVVRQRLSCARDLAYLLGGASLKSFKRSLETLDRFEATIFYDSSPFSITWRGRGFFGGMIYHASSREWSIHT